MDAALRALPLTDPMPVVFLGHGSPMNAIEDNAFTRSLTSLGSSLPKPVAVLVVSAHWLTNGSRVLAVERPRTIHDFFGFPRELSAIEYPASGSPAIARAVEALAGARADSAWGLDHASWAVLRHVYPNADVPVLELSLDPLATPSEHLAVARRLAPLRERGVLIVGSGNLVHNLGLLRWEPGSLPYDWAVEFDEWARERLDEGDIDALSAYEDLGSLAQLAAPTNEHYLPLLYAAALRTPDDALEYTYEGIELGSVSMRCVRFG